MEGLINEGGYLVLRRKDGWQLCDCPFATPGPRGEQAMCGDWCPHFGEPEDQHTYDAKKWAKVVLSCGVGRAFTFEGFEDRRDRWPDKKGRKP